MLNFDAWQRHETVKHLLQWALPEEGERVLDIGGYPGRMRSVLPQYQWVLCDPLVDAPGEQVQGTGDALPFLDSSFELSVSLDVLEHVSPEKRRTLLDEMIRVSRQGMILSFPHRHPLVKAAEQHVSELYRELHQKAHPWLAEHEQFALPDVDALIEHVRAYGGQTAVFDVGAIHRWVYLQCLDVLLEATPNSLDFAKKLDALYQEHLFIHEFKAPAYRKIVLHLFDAQAPLDLSMVETTREEEWQAEAEFHHEVMLGLLQLRLAEQKQSHDLTSAEEQPLEQEIAATPAESPITREYILRMEKGLQLWEDTYMQSAGAIAEAHRWRDQLEQRLSFKLYKRIMRLLGRKIK